MDDSASRRRFLQDMSALGAGVGMSAAFGDGAAQAQSELRTAQTQPPEVSSRRQPGALPGVHLLVGPGTLPSVGKDRMDLLRYRLSGNPRLTGEQLIEPL